MRAVAIPIADPHLEFHWLPNHGFLIQDFLIQGPRRSQFGSIESRKGRDAGPILTDLHRRASIVRLACLDFDRRGRRWGTWVSRV